MNIIAKDRAAVNAAVGQHMISTKSGRDYNQLQTYDPAGTPSTGDAPPSVVVRQVEYDYEDENGDLAYQVVREEFADGGKTFRQRQREGHSWRWSIAGLSPVPYHLPRVLQVLRSGGLIFIVEGEKCADSLNAQLKAQRLNAVATCNNGGAKGWKADQSKWLAGAKVCLLPDNDETGAQHVEIAARHLLPHIKSMKRLELPDLPPKGDIADWLSAGHSIAELQALYHAASEYTPPAEPEATKRERPVLHIVQGDKDRRRLIAWAHKALDGEADELAALNDGRFHAMKAAANRLGTIAAHGLLTESECMASLSWAMDSNQYTHKRGKANGAAEKEALHYFRSGLPFPCDLPAPRDLPALERPDTQAPDDFVAYIPQKKHIWDQGVPVAVRGLLNAYLGTGPLLELIVEGKNARLIMNDQEITVDCLVWVSQKLKRGLTAGVIRAMIRKATDPHCGQFLRKSLQYTDHRDIQDHDQLLDPCQDFQRNPCGCVGRSPEYYSLLPIETILSNLAQYVNAPLIKAAFPVDTPLIAPIRIEFMAALGNADLYHDLEGRYRDFIEDQPGFREAMQGVHDEHSRIMYRLRNPQTAPLPDGVPFKNASTYKSVCAYAFLKSKGGRCQIPRKVLCAFIGCTDAALKGILDRANVLMDKLKFVAQQVRSMAEFNAIRPAYDKHRRGFPRFVEAGGKRIGFRTKDTATFIEAALAAGEVVSVLFHQANMYIIKRLTQVATGLIGRFLTLLGIASAEPVEPQPELLPVPKVAEPEPEKSEKKPKVKREPKPKTVKPTWEEKWVTKFAASAAPLTALSDPDGEIVPPETPHEAVEALFDRRRVLNAHTLRKEEPPVSISVVSNTLILEKYGICPGEEMPIQRLYNRWWDAQQNGDGGAFYAALDEVSQIYLEAFAADEETPETVLIEDAADWLASIGATVTEVVYHEPPLQVAA